MTIIQADGSQGLLAKGTFGDCVIAELGNEKMLPIVEAAIASGDQNLISALFRDYSFLVSAYLLEPGEFLDYL